MGYKNEIPEKVMVTTATRLSRRINAAPKGFTLAEVLITLVVLGLVATLTIPPTIQVTMERQRAVALKKAISTLSEVINQSYEYFGQAPYCWYWKKKPYTDPYDCGEYDSTGYCSKWVYVSGPKTGQKVESDYNGNFSECSKLFQYMYEHMKIVKYCPNDGVSKGCMPEYKGNDTVVQESRPAGNEEYTGYELNQKISGCGGWRATSLKNKQAFVLNNGTIIFAYGDASLIAVDVNGFGGPNKWGYDVFPLVLKGDALDSPSYYPGGCEFIENGGKRAAVLMKKYGLYDNW